MVLCCGYHGWHDWYAVTRWPGGIPNPVASLTQSFEFDDLAAAQTLAKAHAGQIACLIVTPALYGRSPAPGFLQGLRELADDIGAVLIFDEIITGFRWALGGAQEKYGVIPDLAVFAKGMANGMPIAVLVGRTDIMAPLADIWITSTYASETLSIVAALETIAILRETDAIEQLHRTAEKIADGLAAISRRSDVELHISEPLPALRFEFNLPAKEQAQLNDLFIASCARNGVLVRRDGGGFSLCIMVAHAETDIKEALSVFDKSLRESLLELKQA